MTPVRPMGERVLVVLEADAGDSPIITPDSFREPPNRGRILAVGPDVPDCIEVGLVVLLSQYAGEAVDPETCGQPEDAQCRIVLADAMLAVVEV